MKTTKTLFGILTVTAALAVQVASSAQVQNLFVCGNGGNIYEFATNGAQSTFVSGLNSPYGLAFNSAGDLFVADSGSGNIYEFATNGAQSTFVSGLNSPYGLAFNSAGDLFVADSGSGNIYEFTTNGAQSTFVSGLNSPYGLAFNSAGDLFVADNGSGNIYEFTTNGVQSTFASGLGYPRVLAFNSAGDLFGAGFGVDSDSGYIYKFTANGARTVFASGLGIPDGLAFNSAGDLFEADGETGYINEFTANGAQSAFASSLNYFPYGLAFQGEFLGAIVVPTPPYLTVTMALTLSQQNSTNVVGTVATTASPKSLKLATKDILKAIAIDENAEGNWPSNSFPKHATLALAGKCIVVLNGTNILLDVSDIMSINTGESIIITSGKQNTVTGLAKPTANTLQIAGIMFDDTFIGGGDNLKFYLNGVLSKTTTDTSPVNNVYTETQTIKLSTAAGDGSSQDVPFICTGTVSATGKSPLHL